MRKLVNHWGRKCGRARLAGQKLAKADGRELLGRLARTFQLRNDLSEGLDGRGTDQLRRLEADWRRLLAWYGGSYPEQPPTESLRNLATAGVLGDLGPI